MSLKTITAAFGFALAATALTAPVATPARAADEPVTLTWFMWSGSEAEVAAWKHVAAMVTQKYPNIKVEFQTAGWTDYWTKLPALAASGQLPDIISLQSMRTPGFASVFEPLEPYAEKDKFNVGDFDKSIISGLSRDGHLYALPYDFGPWVVFYNKDMFDKAGVPTPKPGWTQADFVKSAKALTKDGKFGAAVWAPEGILINGISNGAPYLNADGTALDITNDKFQAAFQDYADIVAKDKVAPLFPVSSAGSVGLANGRFASGDVAMYVDGPWDLINLTKTVKFKIGLAPVPAGSAGSISFSAGSGFGISTTSKHKDEAWKALQVLTGPEAEQYLGSEGRAFTARTAQQDTWYGSAAKDVDNAKPAMEAALKTAVAYKTTENWNTISNLFEQYAPLAFAGSQTAKQVTEQITGMAGQ